MTDVIFSELPCTNDYKIGVAELNNPKALNALSLSMIRLLHQQLKVWEADSNIAFVILQGAGDKAFCAGGDVVSLYHEIKSTTQNRTRLDDNTVLNSMCGDFFKEEYSLDLYLHEYKKPIVVWGDGYVFGGGMGLFAGASHRITTENTIMAMPETAIGLYPEVGASWFLNKMPNNIGLFLGLTGAFFNASDAKYIGLSNFTIENAQQQKVLELLCDIDWAVNETDYKKLDNALNQFQSNAQGLMPSSVIKENEDVIKSLVTHKSIDAIYSGLLNTQFEDKWLTTAQHKLRNASALSVLLTYKQLELTKHYSKSECFDAELNLSLRCCQYTEFVEGVRAQLVDKDKSPQWAFNEMNEIEPELTSWFFSPIIKT
jgi:enoyl-CoA hydratase/carnithine racemase